MQGWVLMTVQDSYKNPGNPWSKMYLMSWTGICIVLLAVSGQGLQEKRPSAKKYDCSPGVAKKLRWS
jgi:hypothetical protein